MCVSTHKSHLLCARHHIFPNTSTHLLTFLRTHYTAENLQYKPHSHGSNEPTPREKSCKVTINYPYRQIILSFSFKKPHFAELCGVG